ncbi:hypothetical protein [Embleya sp. NPDC005971]|uniref:hypothetical protein n=1 Tax=Embleya sp. NPDC005971 TaxID=3156724 RepID=UPI0033FDBE78
MVHAIEEDVRLGAGSVQGVRRVHGIGPAYTGMRGLRRRARQREDACDRHPRESGYHRWSAPVPSCPKGVPVGHRLPPRSCAG